MVAASSSNYPPYHFERCKIRHRNVFTQIPLQTDCDNKGSSGAAQFFAEGFNDKHVVAAINVNETIALPSGSPYDVYKHFNISVPLEGAFLEAIYSVLLKVLLPGSKVNPSPPIKGKPPGAKGQ